MFRTISERFIQFSGRFTYRQRFYLWVALYFSLTPIPAYWILEIQDCCLSRAELQLQGNSTAKTWLSVHDAVVQYYVEWIHCIVTGESDPSRTAAFKRVVQDAIDQLKSQALISNEEILHRESLFTSGKLVKNNLASVVFLETIWEQIKKNTQKENINANVDLYDLSLAKLTEKIHQIAFDYHIVLQTNETGVELFQMIYFLSIKDQKLLADLNVALERLRMDESPKAEDIQSALMMAKYIESQLGVTRSTLDAAYRQINNIDPWTNTGFDNYQRQLATCYQMIIQTANDVIDSLSSNDISKGYYLSIVKGINCITKTRDNALAVFNSTLETERSFYSWTKGFSYAYLLTLAFLFVVFLIFRFLTRHFIQLESYIRGLSNGQFPLIAHPHPEEELGQFALVLQDMGQAIQSIVKKLELLEDEVDLASKEIGKTAQGEAEAVNIQSKFIVNVEENIGRIVDKTRLLADQMEAFTERSAQRVSEKGSLQDMMNMQTKMGQLKEASNNILETLAIVNKKEQMTSVLTTSMTKISDQSSLLALNAAIEALSVGEHVMPFHDISEKIQNFSVKTLSATDAIKKIVKEMAESVSMGRITAEGCVKEITLGANRVIEVGGQLRGIVGQEEVQFDKFNLVDQMIQSQAELSFGLNAHVNTLNSITTENRDAANNLYKAITTLNLASEELQNLVNALYHRNSPKK